MAQILARPDFSSSKQSCMEHGFCNAFASRYFVFQHRILVSGRAPDHHQAISPKSWVLFSALPWTLQVPRVDTHSKSSSPLRPQLAQLGPHLVTCSCTLASASGAAPSSQQVSLHLSTCPATCSTSCMYFVLRLRILESGPALLCDLSAPNWHSVRLPSAITVTAAAP